MISSPSFRLAIGFDEVAPTARLEASPSLRAEIEGTKIFW